MVNASLNWASIVGIALAICGGGLYFLRSFKPALARDYDVFFAAIGLLCGGILFFQGWRLDPILQFGQFLLAGTTVFFAYESVRLRGIATDQARRSSYFDEEYDRPPSRSNPGFRSRNDDDFDQFREAQPINRRFKSRDDSESDYDSDDEDFYRSRANVRPAIPEEAASRRTRYKPDSLNRDESRRMARFGNQNSEGTRDSRRSSNFGDRRNIRQEEKRGSRPRASSQTSRMSRNNDPTERRSVRRTDSKFQKSSDGYSSPKGTPISNKPEDASFSSSNSRLEKGRSRRPGSSIRNRSTDDQNRRSNQSKRPSSNQTMPRDNSSRFDD